jgi:hypothetical protein
VRFVTLLGHDTAESASDLAHSAARAGGAFITADLLSNISLADRGKSGAGHDLDLDFGHVLANIHEVNFFTSFAEGVLILIAKV